MFKKEQGYDEYVIEQVNIALKEIQDGKLVSLEQCFENAEKELYQALAEVKDNAVYA
ncbi:hypothetical protein ACLSZP_05325 [Avibacterium avium]|uniref:hypothetical protein n=1 Tax=Avibacterium avium TaxID=751 RepID=UPI003BF85B51